MRAPGAGNRLVVKLDPSTGVRIQLDARRAGRTVAEPITLDMEFAEQGGEGGRTPGPPGTARR